VVQNGRQGQRAAPGVSNTIPAAQQRDDTYQVLIHLLDGEIIAEKLKSYLAANYADSNAKHLIGEPPKR
jgi:hypothetical protein